MPHQLQYCLRFSLLCCQVQWSPTIGGCCVYVTPCTQHFSNHFHTTTLSCKVQYSATIASHHIHRTACLQHCLNSGHMLCKLNCHVPHAEVCILWHQESAPTCVDYLSLQPVLEVLRKVLPGAIERNSERQTGGQAQTMGSGSCSSKYQLQQDTCLPTSTWCHLRNLTCVESLSTCTK